MIRCGWWNRWLHRRLRRIDREILLSMLMMRAETTEKAEDAWALHLSMPGNEHWHCNCAVLDGECSTTDAKGRLQKW
mgnify:CR=1 FL=1